MRKYRSLASLVTYASLIATVPASLGVVTLAVSAPAMAHGAPDSFADLAANALPAVVNISSSETLKPGQTGDDDDDGGDQGSQAPSLDQMFKDYMQRQLQQNQQGAPKDNGGLPGDNTPRKAESLGSGFVIDPSGIIVTNNHVIAGADEVTVTLQDNTTLKAKVLGTDDRMDLAVLKVTPAKPLPALKFGDSDKERVGDWVMAIGNPYGLGGTVTAGIVSAAGRDINQGPYDDFIQTDAAINRGNSGGPLFNMAGEVIGINSAIYSPSGGSIGLGFSIPSNMAREVVDQLRDYGKVRRGWLGVKIQEVSADIADSVGLPSATGAMIAGIDDDGPAQQAKLQNGDIILKFDNQDVKDMRTLPRLVAATQVGKTVAIEVWRNGKEQTLEAVLQALPDDGVKLAAAKPAPAVADPSVALVGLGLKVAPLSDDLRDKYMLATDQKGVVVTSVTGDGLADQRGLKVGEVIVEVQQEPVNSPQDVQDKLAMANKEKRKSVLILVEGMDGLRWVPVPAKG